MISPPEKMENAVSRNNPEENQMIKMHNPKQASLLDSKYQDDFHTKNVAQQSGVSQQVSAVQTPKEKSVQNEKEVEIDEDDDAQKIQSE